ncbi:unnamed protein product [Arabidopsis arenosa]|uniref:NAC domain-containing protein n=1 Tax=Arabidopsis arenosa TaxID=38785 RepID=A0A8S1ZMB5_ARAAE|nr:unnamed protein product [Arabidopsis arenosa]
MGIQETDPLAQKAAGYDFSLQLIAEIDLYKFDPWVLPNKALFGEKECNGSTKLDDWVLCRIYKKQSSAQKQVYENVITSGREFSNNGTSSTTSSSSHFEDVLDSFQHENDNRNFQFSNPNRFSSLRPDLTEQKTGFNGLADTSNFDWGSFAGNVEHNNYSVPELGLSHVVPNLEYNCSYLKTEEEVESSHGFNNSGELAQKGYGVDSVGFGYSGQVGGFGFM